MCGPPRRRTNRAADVAAEARRAVAEAERRGERYCPLDPAHRTDADASSADATT